MKISIIVPVLNEQNNISKIYSAIKKELKRIKYEVIFVNDGSTDNTSQELDKVYELANNIKIITFSRNFGKDAAIYAGMEVASAKYTAIIDGDMQQNPKYVIEMYKFLENNNDYDQVCMIPNKRKNMSIFKRIGGKLFYKLMNRVSVVKFVEDASDFRMFRTNVKEAVLSLTEGNRFSKGLFNWVGFTTKSMLYDVEPRLYGKTKFNIRRSINYAMIGIIDYAGNPLHIFTWLGSFNVLAGFITIIYLVIKSIIIGHLYAKYYLLLAFIALFAGINMLGISFICHYLSRMNVEVKKRPIYIIKDTKGIIKDK